MCSNEQCTCLVSAQLHRFAHLLLCCAWPKHLVKGEVVLLAVQCKGQAGASSQAARSTLGVRPHAAEYTYLHPKQLLLSFSAHIHSIKQQEMCDACMGVRTQLGTILSIACQACLRDLKCCHLHCPAAPPSGYAAGGVLPRLQQLLPAGC